MHFSGVTAQVYGYGPFRGKEVDFSCNHNGDFSGDVLITVPEGVLEHEVTPANDRFNLPATETIRIPFEVMEELVAEKVRNDRISALEDASAQKVLYG